MSYSSSVDKWSDEWYEDRIRRRATRQGMFEHPQCVDFVSLDTDAQAAVVEALPADLVPVIVFGSLDSRWTVFGARGMYSVFDGQASLVRFGAPKGSPEPAVPTGNAEGHTPKHEAEWLLYGGEKFWTLKGSFFFSVWNLLLSIERSYGEDST